MFRKFENKTNSFFIKNDNIGSNIFFKYFDYAEPFHHKIHIDIPIFLRNVVELKNQNHILKRNMADKIFNICLAKGGFPFVEIKDNKIQNIFDNDIKNDFSNTIEIIGVNQYINEQQINTGDAILAVVTPGFHFINLSPIIIEVEGLMTMNRSIINTPMNIHEYFILSSDINYFPILKLLWSGKIKKIITPESNLVESLSSSIPNGKRAHIYTNRWGLDQTMKSLVNFLDIDKDDLYRNYTPNIAMMFIVKDKLANAVCSQFNQEQNTTLIKIGQIEDGNLGEKVHLHIY